MSGQSGRARKAPERVVEGAASATREAREADMIEHAMRITGDDLLVAALLGTPPGSDAYHAGLGRLLSQTRAAFESGTPLHAWGKDGGGISPAWREMSPTIPSSLWGELEMLRAMTSGTIEAADPLSELAARREIFAAQA